MIIELIGVVGVAFSHQPPASTIESPKLSDPAPVLDRNHQHVTRVTSGSQVTDVAHVHEVEHLDSVRWSRHGYRRRQ